MTDYYHRPERQHPACGEQKWHPWTDERVACRRPLGHDGGHEAKTSKGNRYIWGNWV